MMGTRRTGRVTLNAGFTVRRALRAVVAVVLLAQIAGAAVAEPVAPAPDQGTEDDPPSAAADAASAAAAAQEFGLRVEVMDQRTETTQVWAEPDGTFKMEQHVEPVRVLRDGGWEPVDTGLETSAGGWVTPEATPTGMSFSGGGTQALVRLADGDRQLTLSWPTELPTPVLDGDTATYSDVLPDVDLQMTAHPQGFSQVLVVKDRAAAEHVARVRYGVSTRGLTLRADEGGNVDAVDLAGNVVFHAARAQMWDSGAVDDGMRRAQATVTLSEGTLEVTADHAFLADPATKYPVFVDPDWSAGGAGWMAVAEQFPTTSYWNGAGWGPDVRARVGYQNFEYPVIKARSYFNFNMAPLHGKHVLSAEFNALNTWASSCSPRVIELWATGNVGPGTTWNTQPPWGPPPLPEETNTAVGGRDGCGSRWVGFSATRAVINAVNRGDPVGTVMLRARDEGDPLSWRKYENNPSLVVRYNSLPNRPTSLSADPNVPCAVQPNEPYIGSATPTLRASVSDPEGTGVAAHFQWYDRGGALRGERTTVMQPSGTSFAVPIPPGTYADGSRLGWRVRGWDGTDHGPWSQWCDITVDQTAPTQPSVRSTDYPTGAPSGGVGRTGRFTLQAVTETVPFSTNQTNDVVGFLYGTISPPATYVPADRLGGNATVLVTPETFGPMDLYVRSVDRAGNRSPITNYHFLVNEVMTPATGRWRLDGHHTGTSAPDSTGRHPGTVSAVPSTATWTTGRVDDALDLNGTSGFVSTAGGPAVDTAGTFTVAGWVRLDSVAGVPQDQCAMALSEDANRASGFYLGWCNSGGGRWIFYMPKADTDWHSGWADELSAPAPTAQAVGRWTHLIGVFDAGTRKMRFYVDGALIGEVPHQTPWRAGGALQIGRGRFNGSYPHHWPGAIDDVQVYDRLLGSSERHDVATTPTNDAGRWSFDEGSGTTAADVSGQHRTGTLTGGATWATGKVGSGAVELDGSTGYVTTPGPAVRTDQSFTVTAWVKADQVDATSRTAVSQDGNRQSGFYLGYSSGRWTFTTRASDADGVSLVQASAGVPNEDEWTHLAGVYDAAARQIRLYVNGEQVADTPRTAMWHATGPLQIGRARWNGSYAQHWDGAMDDVHVYEGVRTNDEISNELLEPPPLPTTVYDGQFGRFVSHSGDHWTASGPVPRGYRFEHPLGLPAPAGAPGTRMLYSCMLGTDEFTSADANCEGQRLLRPIGRVYASPPAGVPTRPIYRCTTTYAPGDHFDSGSADCEGHVLEGLLGYARAYAHLVRYVQRDAPWEHFTSMSGVPVPAGYRPEAGGLGIVALTTEPNTRGLSMCLYIGAFADQFTGVDPGCEGKQHLGWTGNAWLAPPTHAADSRELFRCFVTGNGEHFDSLDPGCEGQTRERSLGYVVLGL